MESNEPNPANAPPPAWQSDPGQFRPAPVRVPHPFFGALDAATKRSVYVPILIAINVIVYVVMGLSGIGCLMPAADSTLPWGVNYWPLTTSGEWWRLLTSAFVHFGLFHVALNMWALYAVGKFTERLYGNGVFLLIYLLSALLSGVASITWEHVAVAAGASGAIFAIYGALMAYLVFQHGSFPQGAVARLLRSTMGFIVINIVFGFSVEGISNSAHLGGLASGFVLGAVFARPLDAERQKRQTVPKVLAGVTLGVVMLATWIALVPKYPSNYRTDAAFKDSFDRIIADAQQTDLKVNALINQSRVGLITDTAFSEQVEKNVVHQWAANVNELEALNLEPQSPFRPLFDKTLKLARLNRDAYQTLVAALGEDNQAKMEEFNRLKSEAGKVEVSIFSLGSAPKLKGTPRKPGPAAPRPQ